MDLEEMVELVEVWEKAMEWAEDSARATVKAKARATETAWE